MKKFLFIALSLCAVLSCSKADLNTNKGTLSFTAGFDEATKSMLNNDRSQSWLGGDKVYVYDVTSSSTISTYATFTNTSETSSESATFKLDEGQVFSFVVGHKYAAIHNATISGRSETLYQIVPSTTTLTYNPSGKYGMPDNTIPVAYFFTYENENSLASISFHNLEALLVVRVTNNSDNPINIGRINLQATSDGTTPWRARFFGTIWWQYNWGNSDETFSSTFGSNKCVITCNNAIAAHSSCDYSTCIMRVYDNTENVDMSVSVTDGSSNILVTKDDIKMQVAGEPRKYKAGDTKVVNITYNPS